VYFKNKLKANKMATDKEIADLANDTEGMSFGDLLEIVTAHYALKEPLEDVMKRLKGGVDKPKEPTTGDIVTSKSVFRGEELNMRYLSDANVKSNW
jgi:hypothetical protein